MQAIRQSIAHSSQDVFFANLTIKVVLLGRERHAMKRVTSTKLKDDEWVSNSKTFVDFSNYNFFFALLS